MTETVDAPAKRTLKPRTKTILIVLPLLLLLLVYGAGFILFPVSVLTNYQNRDCSSALTLHNLYTRLYPRSVQDESLLSFVDECKAYTRAVSTEEKENWQEAYDAYQAYMDTYPNGLYVVDSHERSATALINIAKSQTEAGKYQEAISSLDLVLSSYPDTDAYADALTLIPSTYQTWEADLREVGDFENAIQVLNTFRTWSQTNQNPDAETSAQSELARTYLEWGMSLQSQKQFEQALAKYDLAAAADPEAKFDSAAQVRSAQRKTLIEWGNQFLEQNEFAAAIEKFNLAISHAQGDNDGVRDALSNGYIQWAKSLSVSEDFRGALEQMELAKQAAVNDDATKTVNAALDEIYLAFSKSTGRQAQQAMKEAVQTVCKKNKKPDLPIFGLDKDSIRFGLYGVDEKLPDDLVARTPGEMHYVACVTVERRTVSTAVKRTWGWVRTQSQYVTFTFTRTRVQINWSVKLLRTDTGENVDAKKLEGALPPPFPGSWPGYENEVFEGAPPLDALVKWLRSVNK